MKRHCILITIAGCMSLSVYAQKLSPASEFLLLDHEAAKVSAKDEIASAVVEAFIKIKNSAVVARIEALGAKVHGQATSDYLTASIPLAALRSIAALDEVEFVRAANRVNLLMDAAREEAFVDKAHEADNGLGAYTGKGVVVGIVDNGFEYGHADFYDAEGKQLRIQRVWNQNSKAGRTPEGFDYGTEYVSQTEILAARYDIPTTFHGSHVTGIATGADRGAPYYGVAPDAEIVLVSFRNSDVSIVDGVRYIFQYADKVKKPCVVNLSLGQHKGPHDGTSPIDRTFDAITGPGRIIVGAAGNEAQYRMHAYKKLTAEDNELKTMIGYPNESAAKKISALDIWGSPGAKMSVKVVVVNTLTGRITQELEPIDCENSEVKEMQFPADSKVSGLVRMASVVDPDNHRPNIEVSTEVTAIPLNRKIGVIVTGDAESEVHIWNNYFGDLLSANKAGWTAGDNSCTVGEIGGTSNSVISVGSYNTKTRYSTLVGDLYDLAGDIGEVGCISSFSSYGPTADNRVKPDVAAPGAGVISATSQYSTSFFAPATAGTSQLNGVTYYYDINAGTSMASPFVAGSVALWLQANPDLTPAHVRDIIKATARKDNFTSVDNALNIWGYGKIDVFAGLVEAVRTASVSDFALQNTLMRVTVDALAQQLIVETGWTNDVTEVKLYDVSGRVVHCGSISGGKGRISVAGLMSGIYVVRLSGYSGSVKVAI